LNLLTLKKSFRNKQSMGLQLFGNQTKQKIFFSADNKLLILKENRSDNEGRVKKFKVQ
jgi:hypothetical protein